MSIMTIIRQTLMEIYITPLLCCVRLVSLINHTREGQRASCLPQGEVIPLDRHCSGSDKWPRPSLTLSWCFWAPTSHTKCLILVKYGPWTVVPAGFPSFVQKGQVWFLRAFNSQFSLLHGVFSWFAVYREGGYHCCIIHLPCFINYQEHF